MNTSLMPRPYTGPSEMPPNMGSAGCVLRSVHGTDGVLPWLLPGAYVVLLYFRNLLRIGISREFTEAAIITVLIASLGTLAMKPCARGFHRSSGQLCWAFLFVGLIILSALATNVTAGALADSLYHVVSACLTFWVFFQLAGTRRGSTSFAATLTACAAINAGVGLWGAVTHQNLLSSGSALILNADSYGFDAANGRSGGIMGENYTGMFDVPVVIAGLSYLHQRNRRCLGALLVFFGVGGAVVSSSRTSILCVLAAICTYEALSLRRATIGPLISRVALLLLTICMGLVAYRVYIQHLPASTVRGISSRFSVAGTLEDPRRPLLERYAAEVLSRPILGHGPGYIKARAEMRVVGRERVVFGDQVPHNSFMDIALEFGLPPLLMFVVAMLRPLTLFRSARGGGLPSYLFACFVGMLVPLFTLSNPFIPITWALAGAVVGAASSERRRPSCARRGHTPLSNEERPFCRPRAVGLLSTRHRPALV